MRRLFMRSHTSIVALLLVLLGFAQAAVGAPAASERETRAALPRILQALDEKAWYFAAALAGPLRQPLVDDYILWRQLVGDDLPSLDQLSAFLDRHPDWPASERLQKAAEARIDESVGNAERLAFFKSRPPLSRQGRLRLAEALLDQGSVPQAGALVRKSWVGDSFSSTEQAFILARFGSLLRPEDHLARLDRLLWDEQVSEADRMAPLVGVGQRALTRARARLQRLEGGVDGAIKAVPSALQADAGLTFDRLKWRRRKGQHEDAQALLLGLKDEPYRPAAWWYERSYQIRELMEARRYDQAYRLARGHRQKDGLGLAEAEWLSGWLALRSLHHPADAVRHFERLWDAVSTPISRGRAGYWTGRALVAAGREEEARLWYRRAAEHVTTFYGQLAALELGQKLTLPVPVGSVVLASQNRSAGDDRERLALWLCAAGGSEEAAPFLRRLGSEASLQPDRLPLALRLATECGRPDLVVAIAKRGVLDGAADPLLSYPVPEIRELTDGSDMPADPALLLAVARQESHFVPTARSRAGALGLMQLMPGTAKAVAGEMDLPYSVTRLMDPSYNLLLGGAFLRTQLDRYGNELPFALAAYNAGPARVSQWLDHYGDPRQRDAYGMIDWIESIPFKETRNYVQRVIEGAQVYRALLANQEVTTVPWTAASDALDGPDGDGDDS